MTFQYNLLSLVPVAILLCALEIRAMVTIEVLKDSVLVP